ncbi:alpha-kinase family-domain-containing protein, partial [Baffinella frigidus]
MREIFRCKIMSKFKGSSNYVAKKNQEHVVAADEMYREHVEAADEMYFTDCKMQMIAKKLSEEFNLLKPPHRIDFLECFVISLSEEFNLLKPPHRIDFLECFVISVPPDATQTKPQLYCCERFIAGDYEKDSGDYEKHSANNGSVQLTHHRMTPHAFSCTPIPRDYEKHSGNNGFVQLTHHRMTPHAFSHFTYVKSGGRRMV